MWALSFVLWLYWRVHNCWMLIHSGLLPVISKQLRVEICLTVAERLKGTLISLPKTTQRRLLRWIQMKSCPFEHPHCVTAASRVRVEIVQLFFLFLFQQRCCPTLHLKTIGYISKSRRFICSTESYSYFQLKLPFLLVWLLMRQQSFWLLCLCNQM